MHACKKKINLFVFFFFLMQYIYFIFVEVKCDLYRSLWDSPVEKVKKTFAFCVIYPECCHLFNGFLVFLHTSWTMTRHATELPLCFLQKYSQTIWNRSRLDSMSCVLRSSVTDPCLMFMEKQWNLPRTFLMLSLNSIKGWQQLPKRDILKWCVMKWTHALEFLSPAYNASHDPVCEQTTPRQLFIRRALPSVDSYLLCSSTAAQNPVIYYCLFCQTKYLPSIPQQLTITVRSSRVHCRIADLSSGTTLAFEEE